MTPTASGRGSGQPMLRWSNWNLLLFVPLAMLATPWINRVEPTLLGFPFFYWIQFLFVPVGVACVAIVYVKTRDHDDTGADEGAPR